MAAFPAHSRLGASVQGHQLQGAIAYGCASHSSGQRMNLDKLFLRKLELEM